MKKRENSSARATQSNCKCKQIDFHFGLIFSAASKGNGRIILNNKYGRAMVGQMCAQYQGTLVAFGYKGSEKTS
jgi:hypothetical protein